jgi:hypothetical protein
MRTIMNSKTAAFLVTLAAVWVGGTREASAQLDPLLFLKRTQPNVLLVVDTANRMQKDANNDYYDANVYSKTGALYETTLGVTAGNTIARYRRKYVNLQHLDPAVSGGIKFSADDIRIVGDLDPAYSTFGERTRMAVARRAMIAAISANQTVARFGLLTMRQANPTLGAQGNDGPVYVSNPLLLTPTDILGGGGKWLITRTTVSAVNGSIVGPVAPLVKPDAANANSTIMTTLNKIVGQAGALTPAGRDAKDILDAPVDNMLDDAKAEAARLIGIDTQCRNTVVVLIAGGGEGTTTNEDPKSKAAQFLNISNRRVPIYVIAIAPTASEATQLKGIAANSGGQYMEITAAMVNAVTAGQPVPEAVRTINLAVEHAFASQSDFNTAPTVLMPYGPQTEHQVTSPIIGTVNLEGANDISGSPLPNTLIKNPATGGVVPQRSNVLITTGFAIPNFDGRMRAVRVYKPVADSTKPTGWRFDADGTKLWVASVPAAASRNIFTALPDGTVVSFDVVNETQLRPYMRTTDATALINYVRNQPLGAVVSSTPALMDPPSLDPPPDPEYPAFSDANKDRRSIIWVGANDGMLHALDARSGLEVWAFIPFNLLPKLKELMSGQPIGDFRYFVDGSPKVADVKIGGMWRTYLIMGEGAGGTFYQTFDVTLPDMNQTVGPDSDDTSAVLSYFARTDAVPLKWSFPNYSHFNTSLGVWGDIATTAPAVEKTVGETWSDPAVGQLESPSGPYVVLTGSGFFKYSAQQNANRGGTVAGTTFYVLDATTGTVFDSKSVGDDNKAENVDNCAAANDCTRLKNALQADPVATGPSDSRFITKTYVGDLDGRIWRFDLGLDASLKPFIKTAPLKLYDAGWSHPNFTSMATVNIGGVKQYLFQGTGSDLLPSNGVNQSYALLVILDNGTSGSKTAQIDLTKTDGAGDDEKVTSFPAVAGDIVFFTTTSYKPASPCTPPDGALYAFTFTGGPAYDTNNDGKFSGSDAPKVKTFAGARASAPFIVDQHLVMTAGNKIEMFGDPKDFNNGVGQAGVRILSWREVR